ncbi:peroxisomal biogenesis factor 19 isoform X2 [Thalassophryne amazonica]|uniref:peroxisomal biogenesis factor 19 isoform X2 n=1 Tax=Thalassophryne amazonica TaxID=390379 RepID=UPI001471B160|nr:peroxisomal biogenesis factor 19 isoform X2 [Thalassophryne amazonica]
MASAEDLAADERSSEQDAELDRLLDSALHDFDKMPAPPPAPKNEAASSVDSGTQKPPLLEDCKLFESLLEGDMATQAKEEWEKAMNELAQEPELLQHFQKLSEAAGKVGTDSASQQEFTSCLKETLRGLARNADNLQSSGLAGDDLVKALEGLGLDESAEGGGDDGNILQSIMQNLLSKEVLYPSLKEITTKYPEWLDANRASLSPEDYQRYEQQARVMGDICKHFEREDEGAADKENTFEAVMDLMQQLQDLGQPPKELAGDAPPGLNFDTESLNLPGGPGAGPAEECLIM